jgi:hypothetical protein
MGLIKRGPRSTGNDAARGFFGILLDYGGTCFLQTLSKDRRNNREITTTV